MGLQLKDRALALGRLLRLSLAPSALADAAAGIVASHGVWPGGSAPWLLIGASACVYHGGMALNDWADRDEDARVRADRPIPSGRIRAGSALLLALVLMLGGIALATLADPLVGGMMAAVASAAALYDIAGRGAWRGPLLLAACRAGNLGAGLLLGARLQDPSIGLGNLAEQPLLWALPGLYGAYVFFVSRLGRLEDLGPTESPGRRPAQLLRLSALSLLAACLLAPLLVTGASLQHPFGAGEVDHWGTWVRMPLAALFGLGGSWALFKSSARSSWTGPQVMGAMGLCLRRLLILTGAIAAAAGSTDGLLVAGCILMGYPASFWLRKVFPPS
ncbi:MAG: 4-hydroxybenzoate polyprenyltransferase [Planctomycetota bacterium]|jgi:4-hydroxybenzoate polyprenyltransferase